MSTSGPGSFVVRRKPPHRILIVRGENVRGFTIRPWMAGTLAVIGIAFGFLNFSATGYLVLRDDLLAPSLPRTARQHQAYDDRIATLRADIDRLTSRQLLDQEAFEAKLERLVGKQAALDARQDIIAGLSQAARSVGLTPDAVPEPATDELLPDATDDTASDSITTGSLVPAAGARAPLAEAMLRAATGEQSVPAGDPGHQIGAMETRLADLARGQVDYVESMASRVGDRTEQIAVVLKSLGHDTPEVAEEDEEAVGGPFVPLADNADTQTFRAGVALVTEEIQRLEILRATADKLPLAKPVSSPMTSRFGRRIDPFLGRPALHTGIDFKAATGYPVRCTAAGKVIAAEYAGGYGNMVEIDHGNGVTTRYGHMSRILVKPGQRLDKGDIVGKSGSTGRSTGPHVHYEVRVDGRAIDPMRYIKAGAELTPLL